MVVVVGNFNDLSEAMGAEPSQTKCIGVSPKSSSTDWRYWSLGLTKGRTEDPLRNVPGIFPEPAEGFARNALFLDGYQSNR